MKRTIVLYPGLAVSHFVPMMLFADLLLEHGYGVAVVLIDSILQEYAAVAAVVDRVVSSKPSVSFHRLPHIQHPPTISPDGKFLLLRYLELVTRYNDRLRDFLCSMPPGTLHAVVVDSVSADAVDVAVKLKIPGYVFQTPNAGALSAFLHLPWIPAEGQPSFKEMGDSAVELPGLAPMPASHLYAELLEDPGSDMYKTMVNLAVRYSQSDGFLVNTFESLEARAVRALRHPRVLPPGVVLPPLYCIGPLVKEAGAGEGREGAERHECLAWLDGQPDRSVVFLCFGSVAEVIGHSEEQIEEIAVGLEKSGHRFLWVLPAPLGHDGLLPEGFVERTAGRGLVVKPWVPQVEVLRHRATGAFVTHCGWNSVLEAVTAGVPMLCWPLYAEQKMNKAFMVEEARFAVEMVGWRQGMVPAEEVEAKVRLVMESSEAGREIRARASLHKEGVAVAWSGDGGSSRSDFEQFLSDVESRGPGLTRA